MRRIPQHSSHHHPPTIFDNTILSSTILRLRLLLSLVLIIVIITGSNELRIAVGTVFSWALGHLVLRRLALPVSFRRALYLYIFASFWLLAATNDIFYGNTIGRFWDLYFERDTSDPYVPGSGFTEWHQRFRHRNADEIADAWYFLRLVVISTLVTISLPFVIPLVHWQVVEYRNSVELERTFVYLSEHGELPPWVIERRERMIQPLPESKRDTRYMRLSDDVIFVCGVGGGFVRVVAGDYSGAISRRRGISKEFA